jgi:hypothetical protein
VPLMCIGLVATPCDSAVSERTRLLPSWVYCGADFWVYRYLPRREWSHRQQRLKFAALIGTRESWVHNFPVQFTHVSPSGLLPLLSASHHARPGCAALFQPSAPRPSLSSTCQRSNRDLRSKPLTSTQFRSQGTRPTPRPRGTRQGKQLPSRAERSGAKLRRLQGQRSTPWWSQPQKKRSSPSHGATR